LRVIQEAEEDGVIELAIAIVAHFKKSIESFMVDTASKLFDSAKMALLIRF
jgi:hypothetical protein